MSANPFSGLLPTLRTTSVVTKLARNVPWGALSSVSPIDWLFTSGRANRYNPSGVHCLYMSGDQHVATLESQSGLPATMASFAPAMMYWADVKLGCVLDLSDANVVSALSLQATDLYGSWPSTGLPSNSQLLGAAVSQSSSIVAIRFPSAPAYAAGHQSGYNVVIFRDCVRSPDSVERIGPSGTILQRWP